MFRPRPRKPRDTEQTIEELKTSIDSIERMIEQSQAILKETRPLQPGEARSDSIQFRLKTNSQTKSKSKSKSNSKSKMLIESRLAKLNLTNTTIDRTISSDAKGPSERAMNRPQKTKPQLYLDMNEIEGRSEKEKILIHDQVSPVSAIEAVEDNFMDSSSFADSIENNLSLARRFRTEQSGDSWQGNYLSASLEKKKKQKGPAKGLKTVYLRRQRDPRTRAMAELEEHRSKPKVRIFDRKVEPSKFSKHPQGGARHAAKKAVEQPRRDELRVSTLSSGRPCARFQKESQQMSMEQFLKKVGQYGFVERYLSRAEICCIYEYLRSSSIPEYKWPLHVVDEVYARMQTPKDSA